MRTLMLPAVYRDRHANFSALIGRIAPGLRPTFTAMVGNSPIQDASRARANLAVGAVLQRGDSSGETLASTARALIVSEPTPIRSSRSARSCQNAD
jgi:hypothetical protein